MMFNLMLVILSQMEKEEQERRFSKPHWNYTFTNGISIKPGQFFVNAFHQFQKRLVILVSPHSEHSYAPHK